MWHASVAFLDMDRGRTALVEELSPSTLRVLMSTAKALLSGVGQLPSCVEAMQLGVHYRRAITDAEYALLPAAWCSILPVHQAGHGIVLEVDT